jgi:hypothetical protein
MADGRYSSHVQRTRLYKVRLDDGRVFISLGAFTQQAEQNVTSQTGTKNIVTCEPLALDAYEITPQPIPSTVSQIGAK